MKIRSDANRPASLARVLLTSLTVIGAGESSIVAAQEAETYAVPAGEAEILATIPVADAEPAAVESRASGSDEPVQLEEVVVTSTKRSQSVREIPATIDVLNGEKLESQGARELQDFVDQVPGLQVQDVAVTGSRKIVIRGIAPDNTTNQTVGTLLGDVPLGDPIGSYTVVDPDTWDLATVEVLKGPQGSLFGASSLAGIIRYVPQAPQLNVWKGKAFAEYVSVTDGGAAPTFGGALNIPVGETLAFRLSGVTEHRPGVIDFDNPSFQKKDADDAHKWSGRAMALWEPTDRLTVNALYTAQSRRSDEAFYVTNFDADYTRYDAPADSPNRRSFDLSSLDLRYRFDWATLVSLSAYQNKKNDFDFESSYALLSDAGEAGISVGRSQRHVDARGLMQEFRLVSADEGNWTWQAGAFYSDYKAKIESDIYTQVPDLLGLNPLLAILPTAVRDIVVTDNGVSLGNQQLDPLKANEAALFGETTYKFGSVDVTLGGRFFSTEVKGTSTTAGLLPFATNQAPQSVQDLKVDGKGFSPKAAVAWNATKDVLIYSSVSRGFQYGGVNAVAIPNPNSDTPATYKSSTLWSYEAGIRTDWLDRTLRADLSAYHLRWSDAQVSQVAPPAEAYIDNVGQVKVNGAEMSLRYLLPISGLSLEANGGFLDSKTAEVFTDSDGNDIATGTRMPNAPRVQAAGTVAYARLFDGVWSTATALQYTFTDKAFGNIEHTGMLQARTLFNFNFAVTRADLSFAPSLSVIVNNITDQRKIVSATESRESDTATDGVNYAVGYTRPRTVIVRLGAEF